MVDGAGGGQREGGEVVQCDVLIVGGGTGGVAAAMGACAMGRSVILTEETDWLGGQLTSQAVPPDEHPWIESFGCTQRYRAFRDGVRQYYREHFPLTARARADRFLNPGGGHVSRLCCLPGVALAVIEQMLAYPRASGRLRVLLRHQPIACDTDGDRVRSVTLRSLDDGGEVTIDAAFVLDATELGDLLPLAGVEYVTGAEAQSDTGEPHAPSVADPANCQAITWCFPMAHDTREGADHTIDRPAQYDRWRSYVPPLTPPWCGELISFTDVLPWTLEPRRNVLFPHEATGAEYARWLYRRITTRDHYAPSDAPDEVTLVNWPMNDYFAGRVIDVPPDESARSLHDARQLSLSLLYWLQTEAPRPDGRCGYPGLCLCPELVGTRDGLAKYPYIRESRRIVPVFRVLEQHVGTQVRLGVNPIPHRTPHAPTALADTLAEPFADTVGVGCYRIDLHMSTGGDNYIDISSLPFRIPLGALLPVRMRNLLPAAKNIGTTHITNGCYRLHPVEWNVGESAGLLAGWCLNHSTEPHALREHPEELHEFQQELVAQGVELAWPSTRAV